jgi:eukaryotic-like serine/threonine-protein kinase
MPQFRPPWWIYVIAASFLAYAGLTNYSLYLGVEGLGLRTEFSGRGMVVTYVFPRSPADRLGLQPGDRVVAVDGQAIYNRYDWRAIAANWEVGRLVRLEIRRGTERREVTLTLGRIKLTWSPAEAGTLALQVSRLFMLLIACVIAFSRPHDPAARAGALTVAILGVFDLDLPPGFAAAWRALPSLLASLLWLPQLGVSVLGPIGLTFFASFPRKLFQARWLWVLVWAPALLLMLPWSAYYTFHQIYQPSRVTGLLPHWLLSTGFVLQVVYAGVGAAVLALNYRRLQETNERRRLRLVFAGFLVGVFPQLPFLIAVALPSAAGLRSVILTLPYYILRTFLFLAFPLSFAYAILRHRLFDIRVMIRRGVQYALARRVVLSLVPAVAAVLVLDLLLHGNQPLMDVLRARGWVYGALAGAALVAQSRRRYWLEALDRHFFRERYDAQRLLYEVVEEVHAAGSVERVAPHVVAKIEAALHSEVVALWIRLPGEASYHSLASAPAGHALPLLSAQSKLITLVRVLGKPLELPHTESGWLQQQLPHEETDFLRQARIELLVPVAIAPERTEALLALGPKRSEEPYTREDQDLLVAIAESLALLLERPAAAPARVSEAFEECPQCGTCYDTGAARCGQEGATLVPVRVPRQLAGRYRMERRLGRGGMGTVYAQTWHWSAPSPSSSFVMTSLPAPTPPSASAAKPAPSLASLTPTWSRFLISAWPVTPGRFW